MGLYVDPGVFITRFKRFNDTMRRWIAADASGHFYIPGYFYVDYENVSEEHELEQEYEPILVV